MKKTTFTLLLALIIGLSGFAQTSAGFKYQAVVRDASGDIITDQSVGIQIEILQGSETGTVVYTETHQTTTNAFGLINLNIGEGTVQGGVFDGIDWGADSYFMRVSLDNTGGTTYEEMGTSKFHPVPYSMFSKSVEGIYNVDGKIGIGTPNPNARLEVVSEGYTGDTLFCVKDNMGRPVFIVYPDAVQVIVDTTSTKSGAGGRFLVSGRGLNKDGKGTEINFMEMTKKNYLIGHDVAPNITTGVRNSVIGYEAGNNLTEGYENTIMGYQAGYHAETGISNVYIGNGAGFTAQNGFGNINIGYGSGYLNNHNPGYNVFIGYGSGYYNSNGHDNVYLGKQSGLNGTTGSNNVYIGLKAGLANSGDGNVFIGSNVVGGSTPQSISNQLFIDNSTTAEPLIWGDFTSNTVKIFSNLNINNAYTFPTTDGAPGQVLQTNGSGVLSWWTPLKSINESEVLKLQTDINALQDKIKSLESENESLKTQNQSFEERLKALEKIINQ
jgi:hypothetical protein